MMLNYYTPTNQHQDEHSEEFATFSYSKQLLKCTRELLTFSHVSSDQSYCCYSTGLCGREDIQLWLKIRSYHQLLYSIVTKEGLWLCFEGLRVFMEQR